MKDEFPIEWFEIMDGEYLVLKQPCLESEDRCNEYDEILISRSASIELAHKILNTFEICIDK